MSIFYEIEFAKYILPYPAVPHHPSQQFLRHLHQVLRALQKNNKKQKLPNGIQRKQMQLKMEIGKLLLKK